MKQHWLIIFVLIHSILGSYAVSAQPETVITQCDYQHLSEALETGGSITMDCDRILEVWENRPLTIAIDTSLQPSDGRKITFVALKGRAFVVNPGVTFNLHEVTITSKTKATNGGIENNGGKLSLNDVEFIANGGTTGAAIRNNTGGVVIINNCKLRGNQSVNGGGALYNDAQSEVIINNSLFSQNHSWGDSGGGAIYNLGKMSIQNSTFTENSAHGSSGWGAAILNSGEGTLDIFNSTFSGNLADHSGAAVRNEANGSTAISFSTFVNNITGVSGGAAYSQGGRLTITNSLFSANLADEQANDCQFMDKTAKIILTNNLSGAGCGNIAATGVATLGDNGGPTQTIALASSSNAIDSASECPLQQFDQRGTTRPQGKACDIGAYEYVPLSTAATTVNLCQVTTTRNVRLRTEPNTASTILAVVPHNVTFQAIEQLTGWYHITYGTFDGWLSAEFVTTVGQCRE